jgi:hypothetical protein
MKKLCTAPFAVTVQTPLTLKMCFDNQLLLLGLDGQYTQYATLAATGPLSWDISTTQQCFAQNLTTPVAPLTMRLVAQCSTVDATLTATSAAPCDYTLTFRTISACSSPPPPA